MTGKVICLVSGGIDSPVACALAAEKYKVVPVHYCLFPFTSEESFFRAMDAIKDLHKVTDFEKLVIFPWGGVLRNILENCRRPSYMCVLCRYGMFRAAERICETEGAHAIVTGESLGQKATQTLQNLIVTSGGVKVPIVRPLLSLDKTDTEKISKELGIWHPQHAGCCYATPKGPVVKADPKKVERLFRSLQLSKAIEEGFGKILETKTPDEDFSGYLFELAGEFG